MIAIVNYGLGNVFSLQRSLEFLGQPSILAGTPEELAEADRIILPGVGAFRDAADRLEKTGLGEAVKEEAAKGKLLMGICLGMQLLFDKSYEYGEYAGLGLIPGTVEKIEVPDQKRYKIPQIGWNSLRFTRPHPLFSGVREGDFVYFVHSYHGCHCGASTIAVTDYGGPVTAAVAKENVWGTQFHPEKSGKVGLEILRAFCGYKG